MLFYIILLLVLAMMNGLFYYMGEALGLGASYFILLGGWFSAVIIGLFWFVYEGFLTPHEAKILRDCKTKKRIPVIKETDSGLLQFDYEVKSTPEGAIMTKEHGIMFVPRKIYSADEKEMEAISQIHPVVAKRSFISGVGMPVWFGYSGKGILTNLRTVAELEYGNPEMEGNPLPSQTVAVGASNRQVTVFWPISLKTLKGHFSDNWNQSQLDAQETDAETTGYKRGAKENRDKRMWIYMLIAAGFACFAIGAVIYLLTSA